MPTLLIAPLKQETLASCHFTIGELFSRQNRLIIETNLGTAPTCNNNLADANLTRVAPRVQGV